MSKTSSEVIHKLRTQGKTIPQWARENRFQVRAVRAVIYGHNKGNYGQAHEIAIALEMKVKSK